jgi:DNA polymerase-1
MLAERVACAECLRLGLVPHQDLLFGTFPPARLILQIHDELLFEVNAAFVPSLCRVLRSVMDVSQVLQLRVPLDVRITVGPNYEDMSPAAF